jgi:hypothetical protein
MEVAALEGWLLKITPQGQPSDRYLRKSVTISVSIARPNRLRHRPKPIRITQVYSLRRRKDDAMRFSGDPFLSEIEDLPSAVERLKLAFSCITCLVLLKVFDTPQISTITGSSEDVVHHWAQCVSRRQPACFQEMPETLTMNCLASKAAFRESPYNLPHRMHAISTCTPQVLQDSAMAEDISQTRFFRGGEAETGGCGCIS